MYIKLLMLMKYQNILWMSSNLNLELVHVFRMFTIAMATTINYSPIATTLPNN